MLHAALALTTLLVSQQVAIVTTQHPTTIKAHTRLACSLATPIDSATLRVGDEFTLLVVDPSHPSIRNAKITGHVTGVTQPGGATRASVTYLFDTITFVNGTKEPLRAEVISANVVNRTSSARATPPAAALATFAPNPSTIVWEKKLGPPQHSTEQTGGEAYASRGGTPIVLAIGTPVTVELVSDLSTP